MIEKRDFSLDIIRLLGILIIMVAHASPPGWLFQLRNFGTPLLILGSALTYSFIYRDKKIEFKSFLKKRIIKLTVPLWIFLFFFFTFFYFLSYLMDFDFPFSKRVIIESFLLYKGIGFVWIFKVYIILAFITPFFLKLSKSSIDNKAYFGLIFCSYLIYEVIVFLFFRVGLSAEFQKIFIEYFLIIIPYSLLFLYGLRLHLLSYKIIHLVLLFSLAVFVTLAIQKGLDRGEFVKTQEYKYPPRLYYLSYAFFCINLCFCIVNKYFRMISNNKAKIISWLSSNSLWIYLWHILAFYIWDIFIKKYLGDNFLVFCINTMFLLMVGVIMTKVQLFISNSFFKRK